MRTQKHRANTDIREQLIAKGFDPRLLDSLLGDYRRVCETKRSDREEARSIIKELNGLYNRQNKLASEIKKLQARRLDFLCGQTLTRSGVGPILSSPFNTTLVRSEAEKLKKAADHLDRAFDSTVWRKDAKGAAVARIYIICNHYAKLNGKTKKITYRNVAELLNEYERKMGIADPDNPVSEDAVRRAVERDLPRRLEEQRRLEENLRSTRCQPRPKIAS